MYASQKSHPAVLSSWSLPEKAILHGASALLLGFLVFCAVSVMRVGDVSSQDLFIHPAAASLSSYIAPSQDHAPSRK